DYAPLCEILGRSPIAPEALNCSAPDTGNMEILTMFGTDEQKERWLLPLLEGEIRSCYAMTEPAVASSDATNISCRIERDGDDYVINGRKWWISGAASARCKVAILMGKTDPNASRHTQQTMVLVPLDTPGVTIVRDLPVFGYNDVEGHCEILFEDVRVPVTNRLGEEGSGFALAQARLGPGRIHHCMRAIGVAERALEAMCRRVQTRVAFGKTLAEQGVIQEWVADSRIEIEQARLLTMKTAWLMDTVGNKGARIEISAIKVAVPEMATKVVDRSIQAHGAAGLSADFPMAKMYSYVRMLRFADGPDEVHRMAIARRELRPYEPA
ncbi:MAG: acyl-CoA dehydrogenase family protein, partial [Acidimicrobiales bacterium]|nr:acyl-CoA dehydrogenase family protein [Acidimicrobiales bacterium]